MKEIWCEVCGAQEYFEAVWNGSAERAGSVPRLTEWPDDAAALRAGKLRPDFEHRAKAAGERREPEEQAA